MSALTAARPTDQLGKSAILDRLQLPVKASTKIYEGAAVVIDAGYAAPASTATGKLSAGIALKTYDNSAGNAGDIVAEVAVGTFGFDNSASTDQIQQADVGNTCYFVDDHTVAKTDGSSTRSAAGKVMQLIGTQVYVRLGL